MKKENFVTIDKDVFEALTGLKNVRVECRYCEERPDKKNIITPEGVKSLVVWQSCDKHKWMDGVSIQYVDFAMSNAGYSFKGKKTGELYSKLEVYDKYMRLPDDLLKLTKGEHPLYEKVDSDGWENGKLDTSKLDVQGRKTSFGELKTGKEYYRGHYKAEKDGTGVQPE